ncbi:MAG TPA: S8/S53 family peptidase, partial [Hymenobacter sp.]
EPDLPRYLTANPDDLPATETPRLFSPRTLESSSSQSEWDEESFLTAWRLKSPWLNKLDLKDPKYLAQVRRWNQRAVSFDPGRVAQLLGSEGLRALNNLRLAQLDTGYTSHSKVREGYNLNIDYDAIDRDEDARDPLNAGLGKFPGHGTRTGSLLIGTEDSDVIADHEGNSGLLHGLNLGGFAARVRLAPFRVAQSVILLGRVKEVARAVQHALDYGFQVLTMSMGTLGNAVLADLARTVYDRGVIWACAAGNEVRFVVAPGKYPGVVCVAASNPADAPWSGSCRGAEVDITAPGESVYVPVLTEGNLEDMRYGNGTSYATPHVAAAMLWLAKNEREIGLKYTRPWHRVEAFRLSLQRSARRVPTLPTGQFGAGILDVEKLLTLPLPDPAELRHAYTGALGTEAAPGKRPVALRELEYNDWQQVVGQVVQASSDNPLALRTNVQELASAAPSAMSASAQSFALALEAQAGLRRPMSTQEATSGPSASVEAAYERLRALQQVQARSKPKYDSSAIEAVDKPADIS